MYNFSLFFKAMLTSIFAAISLRMGVLGDLPWLFVTAVVLDYLTGVIAAIYLKQLSSGIGFRGIIKKVGECLIIAAAFLAEEVVAQTGLQLGTKVSTGGAIATTVIIWIILNELISILENIAKMNVDLPPFLLTAIKFLKKQNEASGEKIMHDEK